jgi:DNA-directed RNA polymerase sigma subunit (sigma70/sigma32)
MGTSGYAAANLGWVAGTCCPNLQPDWPQSHSCRDLAPHRVSTSGLTKGAYTVASAVLNIAPEGNLSRYLQEIRKFPMLTPEEELSLAHRWRDTQDMRIRPAGR